MQPTRTPIPPTRGRPHGAAGCAFVLKSRTMNSANTSNESDAAQVDMRWSPLGTCDKTFLLFSCDYLKPRGHLATGESQLIFASDPIPVLISKESTAFLRVSLNCAITARMPVRAANAPPIAFTFSSKVRFGSFIDVHQVRLCAWRLTKRREVRFGNCNDIYSGLAREFYTGHDSGGIREEMGGRTVEDQLRCFGVFPVPFEASMQAMTRTRYHAHQGDLRVENHPRHC
jgi:hypothetical protein